MQLRHQWEERRRVRERRFDFELKRGLFLQHDQNIANASGASVRADINNALGALFTVSSGTSAPGTTIAYMLWADTTNNLLKQRNAANSGWLVRGTLAETFVIARSSNTILGIGDVGRTINATSTFTQTLTAAATLGDGWWVEYRNNGTGVITLDPNSTETIDGAQVLVLYPGESCVIWCNGTLFTTVGRTSAAAPYWMRGHLHGLTLSNNGTDPTNDIDVATGVCTDSTFATLMALTSGLTKQLDVNWAVGNNAGMLDTGAVANNTYHIFLIRRPDTGVVDVLASLSATAPTMPTNYTEKRRIGSIVRASAAIRLFTQIGDDFYWSTPPALDQNAVGTTGSRTLVTVAVPTGIRVKWYGQMNIIGGASGAQQIYLTDPANADVAPGGAASPLSTIRWNGAASSSITAQAIVWANTSAQIGVRVQQATDSIQIQTIGWMDRRGRDE